MSEGLETIDPYHTALRREAILSVLDEYDGPVSKRTIGDDADVSRSTVDRAIRELERHGFVERREDGWQLAVAGRLALSTCRRSRATLATIEAATPLLDRVPQAAPISPAIVTGATVYAPETGASAPDAPAHADLVDVIVDRIRDADRVVGFTPAEPNPRIRNAFSEVSVEGTVDCEIGLGGELADFLVGEHTSQLSQMVTEGRMDLWQAPSLPYGLGIYETPEAAYAHLFPYGDNARLLGIVENPSPEAVAWAERVYREFRDRGHSLTPGADDA